MRAVTEPNATALVLAILGALTALSVLSSRASGRAGVPVALLFIVIGMVAGSEGLLGVAFEDYAFTFRLGSAALVLILFDGGLNTPLNSVKEGIRPAALLATVGVVLMASFTAVLARLFGMPWEFAMLLGAIVSSTDAAAVFAVLRGSGLHLKRKVGITLELESGLNDPMAIILTMFMAQALVSQEILWWRLLLGAIVQMVVGAALGFAFGYGGRELLKRVKLTAGGLYPVLSVAVALLCYGVPSLLQGSGFLAVYIAGVIIGNGSIRYRSGVLRVHDALAWLSQVGMFLMLGLLVYPSQLLEVAPIGLGIGLAIAFIARPLAVIPLLLPFQYKWRERLYMSWVGLRGAVPIVLATFPVLLGAPNARDIFNIVFFVVVVNAIIPGSTVQWLTKKLGLLSNEPPAPPAVLEITSTHNLSGELVSYYVDRASAVHGAAIADLPFPSSSVATLIVRGTELLAPKGRTVLEEGDHVYVFCKPEDLDLLNLLFGRQESA